MNIDNNTSAKSKKNQNKTESPRGDYTSYNSLAGKSETKSVAQSMHEFITNGFAKLTAANDEV